MNAKLILLLPLNVFKKKIAILLLILPTKNYAKVLIQIVPFLLLCLIAIQQQTTAKIQNFILKMKKMQQYANQLRLVFRIRFVH